MSSSPDQKAGAAGYSIEHKSLSLTQANRTSLRIYGMRFISVFTKLETCYAVGFDELADATDFLFWGYEEYELLPHGIYDVLTGEITPYAHRGGALNNADGDLIRSTAVNYLLGAARQHKG